MNDTLGNSPLFILGAGATKAFAPRAPLVEDDFGLPRLQSHFRGFPHAISLLENSRICRNGKINVEQMLTRLHGRMPYDSDDARAQQSLLLSELLREFIRRIELARAKDIHELELAAFARLILEKQVTCITFNYDDILDQALWKESERLLGGGPLEGMAGRLTKLNKKYWHPDGGYGVFIRPSWTSVENMPRFMDETCMLLLKLHGSINWYPSSGEQKPYRVTAIYHHEDWSSAAPLLNRTLIDRHLESEPFLIPPVLDKSVLGTEPVLKTIWQLAKKCLELADQIIFVGYSMPMTDLAASFLFSETLGKRPDRIQVINLEVDPIKQAQAISAYRQVFPDIKDTQFDFGGALPWVRRICKVDAPHKT